MLNWRAFLDRLRSHVADSPEASDVITASARIREGFSRRTFLRSALIGLGVAATVDVERLLWTPGEKAIFLPTLEETLAHGNGFITPGWVTHEALRLLKNHLGMATAFNRQYADTFDEHGARVGDTVAVNVPARYSRRARATRAAAPVVLTDQVGVEFEMSPADAVVDKDRFIAERLTPATAVLANEIRRRDLRTFAGLALPVGLEAATAHDHTLGIRGILLPPPEPDRTVWLSPESSPALFRLDVLGGRMERRTA